MSRFRIFSQTWLPVAAGGVLASILSLPQLSYPFSYDQGLFADVADAMRRGGVVYRDVWEHKPPGIYYVYYLAFMLFGRDFWSVRLIEVLAIGIGSAGLVRTAQRWFGSTPAGLVSALALPLLYLQLGPNSAQPETFQIPLLCWTMACWPIESDPGRLLRRSVGCGLLLSATLMFKTPAATVVLIFWLDRWIQDSKAEEWKARVRPVALFTLALCSAPLAVLAYYSARGLASEVWDALVVFPINYNRWAGSRRPIVDVELWTVWIRTLLPASALALLMAGLARGFLFRRRDTVRCFGILVGAWASLAIQRTGHIYLDMVLLPPLALGMGLLLLRPDPSMPEPRGAFWMKPSFRILAPLLLFLTAGTYALTLVPLRERIGRPARLSAFEMRDSGTAALVRCVRARSAPVDRIFIWGDEPLDYFLFDRPMAGPYPHLLSIVPPWGDLGHFYLLMARLEREQPRLIVLCPGTTGWWGVGAKTLMERFPEIKEFIRDAYVRVETIQDYEIWERKP